jgi:septal ring factor EnvC (AmiA/AmiB activator)
MKTHGKVIDATAYRAGISNMEPGAQWDPVFVARRAKRVKNKELLCAVMSMPDWYALIADISALQKTLRETADERDKLSKELHDARVLMYQTREMLHQGAKHITKTMDIK